MSKLNNNQDLFLNGHQIILHEVTIEQLSEIGIAKLTETGFYPADDTYRYLSFDQLIVDYGVFTLKKTNTVFPTVKLQQQRETITATCTCNATHNKLCIHQATVLLAVHKRDEFRVFFDYQLRHDRLRRFAMDYGLEQETDLDRFFNIELINHKLLITPAIPSLLPVTKESLDGLKNVIVKNAEPPAEDDEQTTCIILRQHKYYQYLFIELYNAALSKEGKLKNPLTPVSPLEFIWKTDNPQQLKFYTGVHKFQSHQNKAVSPEDITALKAIIKNPLEYEFYYHDPEVSENITASSVVSTHVTVLDQEVQLSVKQKDQFFELSGTLQIGSKPFNVNELKVRFGYFIATSDGLHLAGNLQQLNILSLLTKKQDNMLVHTSKFDTFKKEVLSRLEDKVNVKYEHIPPATHAQLRQHGFNNETERIIYLSDFGAHVMIIPVMRYGEVEISVRTKKQIYAVDEKGKEFMVKRDDDGEIDFTALLVKQHVDFHEQLQNDLDHFYLHKRHFLNEEWFLEVFEEWHSQNITVLGFNELEGNKLNPHKVKINIKVLSGLNWFNVKVDGRFGKTKANLKQIYRAVKNKTRYVQLDDGTTGILPTAWIDKFRGYFNAGEVADDDTIEVAKSNFTAIEQLFDAATLDENVRDEIHLYHQKLEHFEAVTIMDTPVGFTGNLRTYQKEGLSWLNFLDDFNFGGCLADDMGLGKTVQIIAFILSQREKVLHNTNLVVVPTSLIYNWQHEITKFAPSVRVRIIYGADRIKNTHEFDDYEVVLTSYGTLLADIVFLKDYTFNYIFLDESQQIKNPESQRYKAVRLLRSRNKIVLTGTPVENNTFDLYGQLSFACPGLLGSKTYFKQIYSSPIDMFKSGVRAQELQKRIKPFVLRRTKQQVATDLPEKTEMVLYCELKEEQRKIYNAYEREFRDFIEATTGDELKKTSMNVLKGLTKLRQICDSPMLIKGEKMPGNASAKIDVLMEEIEGKKEQHKILIFSQFVTMLDLIRQELRQREILFTYLTGKTRNRQAAIDEFQNNPDVRVFLISLKAGGTGLNLTEADYVYLVDPWWNPAVENQAIDRCHRIGQDKNIVAVRLICPDTVEEKVMIMQETKRDLASNLVKEDEGMLSSSGKEGLLALLK